MEFTLHREQDMRPEYEVERAVEEYSDMVRRICLLHLKNYSDSEDIFQTVFLKYALFEGEFESREHEKAWLIRVTLNACKDFFRNFARLNTLPLDVLTEEAASENPEYREVLEAVMSLPKKYKDVIYLHYYEGYSGAEIGQILRLKEGSVYSLLSRGRDMLKERLGDDYR